MYTHCHILQVYNYTKPLGFWLNISTVFLS
jgi:hypothetical protein